jgi:hypothetical protein
MNRPRRHEDPDPRDQLPQEVTFSIIDSPAGSGELLNANSRGTLIELDDHGISLVTRVPIEPGNIVRLDHRGVSKVGIVMWSVESADNCRIQIRFI